MPLHVHLEAVITDIDKKTRRWHSFVHGFEPNNTLHDVLYHHDTVTTDPKHTLIKFWDARRMQSALNKIILETTVGEIELEKKLSMNLHLLHTLNSRNDIMKIKFRLELGCLLDAFKTARESSLPVPESSSNALTMLMQNQRCIHANKSDCEKLGLPDRKVEQNGKDKLHNRLIEYFIDKQISLNNRSSEGRDRAWKLLVKILWKLNEVGIKRHEWKQKPPKDLDLFLGHSFYDVSASRGKKKRPSLTQGSLSDLITHIKDLQTQDWLRPTSNVMPTFLDSLLRSLVAQLSSCVDKAQRMSTLRVKSAYEAAWKDLGPGDLVSKHNIGVDILEESNDVPQKYHALNQALKESREYDPIMIHEYLDGPRNDRFRYKKNLEVGCKALLFCIKHGGNARDDLWICKVDPEAENHMERSVYVVQKCIDKSKNYIESWVGRAFQNLPIPGCHDSRLMSTMREYLSVFVGDMTSASSDRTRRKKALIELSIQSGDSSLLEDARKLNRREECHDFEEFWRATQEHLNGVVDAAHARRHGMAETGYFSDTLSCRELHETVEGKLREELGDAFDDSIVPSLSTLYLQFMPSSNKLLTEARFKSRFAVQMKVQKRILHIDHPDSHYGNAIIKYLRSFAARYKDVCSFFSADDKARIMIGPPGVFLQSGVRNKPQLAPDGIDLLALDHDYDGTCLVPSVYLKHEIPDRVSGDWYKRSVTVGLKDGVFQKSCPWRHAEELYRQYQSSKTPILMLLTDGGPDRMLKRATVMAAQIALFISLDLDMLIVSRTVPYLSFRNPVERVMSTLNYALQNVSLCREGSPTSILEQELKGCNSMAAIREKAKNFLEGEEAFRSLFRSSLQRATRMIGGRMSRLKWKGDNIGMYESGTMENIAILVEAFLSTDDQYSDDFKSKCRNLSSLDWSELQRRHSPIKEFIHKHVRQSPYVLQMKKIDGCDCTLCKLNIIKAPRLDHDTFADLKWLPLPLKQPLSADGKVHYKNFEDLYGLEPNHTEQPSLKKSDASSKGQHGLYTGNRARSFVKCSSCARPRVIYVEGTNQSLTKDDKAFITRISDGEHYTCGSQLTEFVPSVNQENDVVNLTEDIEDRRHDSAFCFYLRDGLTCDTPVESTYFFSARLYRKRNLNICSCCGLSENHIQKPTQEELDTFSGNVFYPCSQCIKTRTPKPQPYRGSKRKRKSVSSNAQGRSGRPRTAEESGDCTLMELNDSDGSETQPSGDYSEHDD